MSKNSMRSRANLIGRLATGLFCALGAVETSWAWKPTTHVYAGEIALKDALDDGRVTIPKLDASTGEVVGMLGSYAVEPRLLAALRSHPQHYRAGILGPDAYPDIVTGQQVIHPPVSHGGSNSWLQHIWNKAQQDGRPEARAFAAGYLTHAAGDMYGHTFVNNFSGAPFTFEPPTNAIKHVVVEGYVDTKVDKTAFSYDARIDGLEGFIYDTLIAGAHDPNLYGLMQVDEAKFSVPFIFSTLKMELQRDIEAYYSERNRLGQEASDCGTFDMSCSAVALRAQQAALIATEGPIVTYKEAWRDDIDEGPRKWPEVSHKVARALFFNPNGAADIKAAEDILSDYAVDHLLSMSGSPDALGFTISVVGDVADAVTPDFLLDPIRELKEDMLNAMLEEAIGMSKDELKQYLTSPERYFDATFAAGPGENISRSDFDARYLKLDGRSHLDPNRVDAIYNTAVMSRLIYLAPSEMNRLLSDLGSSTQLSDDNVMLGFIQTLDGDNQWVDSKMAISRDCAVYSQVFKPQAGAEGCGGNQATVLQNAVLKNGHGLCLDQDVGEGRAQLWACHSGPNQRWTRNGKGQIVSAAGKCLDVPATEAGTTVHMWECMDNNPNQVWSMDAMGRLVNRGKCLDADGRTNRENGGRVQIWNCQAANDNQIWR